MGKAEIAVLDGERITLGNAERLVKKRFPRARVTGSTDLSGRRHYFVYRGNFPSAGEMYIAYGNTKKQAWKNAAIALATRESRSKAPDDRAVKQQIDDIVQSE